MQNFLPNLVYPSLPVPGVRRASASIAWPWRLAMLALALGCVTTVRAADPYVETLDKHIADLEGGLKQQEAERAQGSRAAGQARNARGSLPWAGAAVLAATIAAHLVIRNLNQRFGRPRAAKTEDSQDNLLLNEQSVVSFFEELRTGPAATESAADGPPPAVEVASLHNFLDSAPAEAKRLQSIFGQASRSGDTTARQKALLELSERLRSLCYGCRAPELRSIWQLSFALEGLAKQLADDAAEITASTLQSVASGLDVLHALCVRGTPELTPLASARFLVVDDDAVSRFAMTASLKKAFAPPDLAPEAETGLALAAKQAYDAIFLDVEMPGMDGYELCKRIRETTCNPTTPVVFVTRHSGFESRAKAALSGGQYLLGKPFLALEITVKALTLFLRPRQQSSSQEPKAPQPLGTKLTSGRPASESVLSAPAQTPLASVQPA